MPASLHRILLQYVRSLISVTVSGSFLFVLFRRQLRTIAPKAKASRPDKDKRSAEHEVPGPQSQVSLKRFFEQVPDKEPIPQPVLWPEAENDLGGLEKSKETVICSDCRLRKEVSEPGGVWVGSKRTTFKCGECNRLRSRLTSLRDRHPQLMDRLAS